MEHREVSKLKPNPNNPRGEVVIDDALRELTASIKEQGVLQPPLITPDDMIVIGHRRIKAAELAGLVEVPVVVKELTESQQIQIMLIENLQREDLSALQVARAYKTLTDHGLSIAAISRATGFRAESISKHLSILDLAEPLHQYFDSAFALPLGGIRYLLELAPPEQLRIGKQAAEKCWTIAEIAQAINRKVEHAPRKNKSQYYHVTRIIDQLEAIDEKLDEFPSLKAAQNLLRQASRQLINGISKTRAA